MKLTGKCKEAFEKWYIETRYKGENNRLSIFYCLVFHHKPDSEKYGVYVDFFDSVGIVLNSTGVFPIDIYGFGYSVNLNSNSIHFKTRPEARKAAIEKANEIFNQ